VVAGEAWVLMVGVVGASSVGIVGRSLVNEWRERQEELAALEARASRRGGGSDGGESAGE